ncbi:MAG TPA: DUF4265 domain-containing protein [Polyangiaceae bacterium]|jgi:hypothetical protein|nr:DUF4265 domain-containing protein [Polyangiaceae bacterium]
MKDHVKLRFPFTNSRGEGETEAMWTLRRDEGYEIDNIPFYATGVALGDIVGAEPDIDGVLWYSKLVRPSGHSTIQIFFSSENDVDIVREELKRMGCDSEVSDIRRLVAVDVPPSVPYARVKEFLDRGAEAGTFEYQEACLGFL